VRRCLEEGHVNLTLKRPEELAVAVEHRGNARKARSIVIARLDQTLAGRDLAAECLTLRPVRVRVDRVRPVADVVGHGAHLDVWARESVREDDAREVDVRDILALRLRGGLVRGVHDGRDVRRVSAAV
jgi:hypothetical protein